MKWMLACGLGLSLMAAACSDPVAPPSPTPVEPTITETFTGTLLARGSNQHLFSVQQIGGLVVTVSDITPKITIGFALGVPGLGTCAIARDTKAVAGETTVLAGTITVAAPYCIAVFDAGDVVDPVTYTVTVKHS
jgi:hypothetical protein